MAKESQQERDARLAAEQASREQAQREQAEQAQREQAEREQREAAEQAQREQAEREQREAAEKADREQAERAQREAEEKERREQAERDEAARQNEGSHGKALTGTTQAEQEAEAARLAERDRQDKAQKAADEQEAKRNKSPVADAVRRANALITASPDMMRLLTSGGAWQDPDDARNPFADHKFDVPAGKYRLRGRDFVMTFKRDRLVAIEKAGPNTDPKDIVEFDANPPRG